MALSLQFLALEEYMLSDGHYDDNHPVMKNILFDISMSLEEIDEEILEINDLIKQKDLEFTKKCEFKSIFINMTKYNDILEIVSDFLFDEFTLERLDTVLHAEWKEYFHGLYELVVITSNSDSDKTQRMINIHENLKYFDVLDEPEMVQPFDKLYPAIQHCRDIFKTLKKVQASMIIPDFKLKIQKTIKMNQQIRVELMKLKKFKYQKKLIRQSYLNILKWSTI